MLFGWFEKVLDFLFLKPLYKIYRVVWWENQTQEQICTVLNPGTTVDFWKKNEAECYAILYSKFESWHTILNCGLWVCAMYQSYCLCTFMLKYYWISRTQNKMIQNAVKSLGSNVLEIQNGKLELN